MTRLELPWPPSVNHYWRMGRGHFYVSPEGQRYKLAVCGILATAGVKPLSGPVLVTLDAFPPDRRRRDLDNIEKATWDACVLRRGFSTGLYHDDSQIKRKICTLWDHDPNQPGRIVVTIEPWLEALPVGVPVDRPPPALSAARVSDRRRPVGDTPCPNTMPASSWPSATPTSPTRAIPPWRRFVAWLNCYVPTTW